MKNLEARLREFISLNGISFSEIQITLLFRYVENLLEQNKKVNLISRKDEDNVIEKHIIPCIIFSTQFNEAFENVLDIGTGGGLPGIPFAIVNQNSRITLIDSIKKKILSVNEIVQKIGLYNVETVWTRAEDSNFVEKYKNSFDLIISRATADLKTLIEYSKPLLKNSNSKLASMKGGNDLDREIADAKKLFEYIAIQKIPLTYLPENPENINKKYIIIVERIDGRK